MTATLTQDSALKQFIRGVYTSILALSVVMIGSGGIGTLLVSSNEERGYMIVVLLAGLGSLGFVLFSMFLSAGRPNGSLVMTVKNCVSKRRQNVRTVAWKRNDSEENELAGWKKQALNDSLKRKRSEHNSLNPGLGHKQDTVQMPMFGTLTTEPGICRFHLLVSSCQVLR